VNVAYCICCCEGGGSNCLRNISAYIILHYIVTILHLLLACWKPKATNTQSECIILTDFTLQQWLHERAAMLHYTSIAYLVVLLTLLGSIITVIGGTYLCVCCDSAFAQNLSNITSNLTLQYISYADLGTLFRTKFVVCSQFIYIQNCLFPDVS
jgi:uncharacterized MnhB-related membrane protein